MLIDLHVHTTLSPCSELRLADLLAHARSRGLDGVCITDHNTTEACRQVQEGLQPESGLLVVVGLEYDTPQGDFLVFGAGEDLAPGLGACELLARVELSGGVAVAAHPFRAERPLDGALLREGSIHILEGLNGRNTPLENRKVASLGQEGGLHFTGGSDAHHLDELGCAATLFRRPLRDARELVEALKSGACSPARPTSRGR